MRIRPNGVDEARRTSGQATEPSARPSPAEKLIHKFADNSEHIYTSLATLAQ